MTEAIAAALVTGVLSLAGTYMANRKSAAVIEYRIRELEKKQDRHNRLIERTYRLEDRANIADEKMRAAGRRIEELERKVG